MANSIRVPAIFTAVDNFSSVVNRMTAGVSAFGDAGQAAAQRFSKKMHSAANTTAMAGAAILAPLGVALNKAIEFEDKMADVAKTTGLNSIESEKYGNAILDMSKKTRTSITALQDIGIVAGTIGVAKDELVAFTKAGNDFAIALGSDFGNTEDAVTSVAKLKNLFKEVRSLDIATSMTRAGSAINEISNAAGSPKNINEFMLRIGQLPDAMKPSIQETAALGGLLEDSGLSAEIASGGFTNLMLVAGKNMSNFASQMGMSTTAANRLYETDPTKFATTFAKSLQKMKPRELATTLDNLKVGTQESIKVVGSLASNYDKLYGSTKIVNGKLVEQKGLIQMSNDAFSKGTSLTDEAQKKNDTLAGKLAIAKNNMEALAITIGTQLAPSVTKLVEDFAPVVEKFSNFIKDNPEVVKGIALIGGGLLILSGILKGIAIVTEAYTGIVWLFNAAMAANPVTLIVIAIVALIALIGLAVAKFDSWGATLLLFLGPIGRIISAFKLIYDHWESIKKAFQTDGILGGIKRIGIVLLDVILKPLQQILGFLSDMPLIGGLASKGLEKISALRTELNLVTPGEKKLLDSPQTNQVKATANANVNGQIGINVSAKQGTQADVTQRRGLGIPINITSTQGAF